MTIAAISALELALEPSARTPQDPLTYEQTVIALDANIILRLSAHRKSEDVIDYLRTSFPGKLLLPGQVVQEFWNNRHVVETVAGSIKKHFISLKEEVEKIDSNHGDFATRFQTLMEDFQTSYGYVYDDKTSAKIKLLVSLLSEKALVPYCRRNDLSSIALSRKRTKTPPGFKDELDGDFFVWADLLLGVAMLKKQGFSPSRVVLVTKDAKIDWVLNGVPHPILSAEMKALCGATFQIWSLDELTKIVPA